ncbi:hypothetical protein Hanom_Chr07g00589251 [Helianthus anomalus]
MSVVFLFLYTNVPLMVLHSFFSAFYTSDTYKLPMETTYKTSRTYKNQFSGVHLLTAITTTVVFYGASRWCCCGNHEGGWL